MIPDTAIKLLLSLLFGAVIGFEREYRSKAAGFRTITLISLGSTLFTIISYKLGSPGSPDRIASNIITGIGFIGAGVIFKDGLNVSGLTTAATIWVTAAVGMAIGVGDYKTAGATLLASIIVLATFEKVQEWIENFHQLRNYRIDFKLEYHQGKNKVEEQLKEMGISYSMKKITQTEELVSFFYEVGGKRQLLDQFSEFLANFREIKSFAE